MDDDLRQRIFERVRDTFEEVHQRAEKLKGDHGIPAKELFSNQFMRKNTPFDSLAAFLRAGDFEIGDGKNIDEAVSTEALDRHVRKATLFEDWDEMKQEAAAAWVFGQSDE